MATRSVRPKFLGIAIYAGVMICASSGLALILPGGGGLLDSWSFDDTNSWTSDLDYAPVSYE